MKKTLMILALTAVGSAATTAMAAPFSLNASLSLGAGVGLNVGVTDQNLFTLGNTPVDGRISADIGNGGVRFNGDALVNYDAGSFNLYGGPGINIGSASGVGLNLVGGVSYPISDRTSLYAEGSLRLLNTAPSVFRLGINYDF